AGTNGTAVQSNYIGTNAAGTGPLANAVGVRVDNGAASTAIGDTNVGNLIAGNTGLGVSIGPGTTGTVVKGNTVGLAGAPNGAGVGVAASSVNLIGGGAGQGNTIGPNTGVGVAVDATGGPANGNSILGNSIAGNGTSIVLISGANHAQVAPTISPV